MSSKIEFVCLFFGGNVGLKKSFRFCLTFRPHSWTNPNVLRKVSTTKIVLLCSSCKQFLDVSITFPASKNVNPNITYYGVDEYLSFKIGNYILEII